MSKKIVINKCFGGFSISPEAALWLYERGFDEEGFATPVKKYWTRDDYPEDSSLHPKNQLKRWREYLADPTKQKSIFLTVFSPDEKLVLSTRPEKRDHPLLIKCVETLKEKANGAYARLKIVKIPDDAAWEIDEYDGMESVREPSRSWT